MPAGAYADRGQTIDAEYEPAAALAGPPEGADDPRPTAPPWRSRPPADAAPAARPSAAADGAEAPAPQTERPPFAASQEDTPAWLF